jgi:hypothetical protein
MTETLRVDTGLVLEAGGRLQGIAGAIPPPPTVFKPTGADALSTAIAGKVAEVVDPVVAQLPIVKEDLHRYAQNVMNAANTYDRVDREIAEEIVARLNELDAARAGGEGGSGGGSAAGATGPASSFAAPASSSGAMEQGGDMSQMVQSPMQMAQQAAQTPAQMAGVAGAVPVAMMQGVQAAVQQVGQLSKSGGEENPDDDAPLVSDDAAAPAEKASEAQAGPGATTGERIPEPPRSMRGDESPRIAL